MRTGQTCDYQSPSSASKSVKDRDLLGQWYDMGKALKTFFVVVNSFNFANVKTMTNGFHLHLITPELFPIHMSKNYGKIVEKSEDIYVTFQINTSLGLLKSALIILIKDVVGLQQ